MATGTTTLNQSLVDLSASVMAETTVEASAVTLIQALAAQIGQANASGNPAEVESLVQQIKASSAALAAAVAANTVASPDAAAVATGNLTPAAQELVQTIAAAPANQAATPNIPIPAAPGASAPENTNSPASNAPAAGGATS